MSVFAGVSLGCIRGERPIFAGLDFALSPGDALTLRGPNGSGKTSLLRLMAGLSRPAAGVLSWDGAPIADAPDSHAARIAYIGHLDGVKPALTCRANLVQWARLRAAAPMPRLADTPDAALDAFGIGDLGDIPARHLSAGQRRRLALGRAAMSGAPIWLLDEPLAALDDAAIAMLGRVMAAHLAAGGMICASTHAPLPLDGAALLDLGAFAFGAGA